MSKTKPREIPFSEIEQRFTVTAYAGNPAVAKADTYYSIRIHAGQRWQGSTVTTRYDFFYCELDGTVITAPRGYAREYKPGRITGLDEAVKKYAGGAR